jgi:hypothetical protein
MSGKLSIHPTMERNLLRKQGAPHAGLLIGKHNWRKTLSDKIKSITSLHSENSTTSSSETTPPQKTPPLSYEMQLRKMSDSQISLEIKRLNRIEAKGLNQALLIVLKAFMDGHKRGLSPYPR